MQFQQYQYDPKLSLTKMDSFSSPPPVSSSSSSSFYQTTRQQQQPPPALMPSSLEPTPVDTTTMNVVNNVTNTPTMRTADDMQLAMFCLSPLVNNDGDDDDDDDDDDKNNNNNEIDNEDNVYPRISFDDLSKSDLGDNDLVIDQQQFQDFDGNAGTGDDDCILLNNSTIRFSRGFQPFTASSRNNGNELKYVQSCTPDTTKMTAVATTTTPTDTIDKQGEPRSSILTHQEPISIVQPNHKSANSWLFDDDSLFDISPSSSGPTSHGKSSDDWVRRFQELCLYKQRFGSCAVPHDWKENRALANWVKRQRYQYSLKKAGKHSTLTDARQQALEQIGFRWKLHKAMWDERFNELKAFRATNGHCNVPSRYPPNPTLAIWVQSQRRQYKLFMKNKTSHMTTERIERLRGIGFEWSGRDAANKKT